MLVEFPRFLIHGWCFATVILGVVDRFDVWNQPLDGSVIWTFLTVPASKNPSRKANRGMGMVTAINVVARCHQH